MLYDRRTRTVTTTEVKDTHNDVMRQVLAP